MPRPKKDSKVLIMDKISVDGKTEVFRYLQEQGADIKETLEFFTMIDALWEFWKNYLSDGLQSGDLVGLMGVIPPVQQGIEGIELVLPEVTTGTLDNLTEVCRVIADSIFGGSEKAFYFSLAVLSVNKAIRGTS